jgi:hypothetical protein
LPSTPIQVKANRGQTREFTEENEHFGKARFLTTLYLDSDFARFWSAGGEDARAIRARFLHRSRWSKIILYRHATSAKSSVNIED